MSIATEETPRIQYTANGSTVEFPITFSYNDESHVKVAVDGTDIDYGLNYTVADGAVTTLSTYDNGQIITIYRETPITQEVTCLPNQALPNTIMESVFDKAIMILSEIKQMYNRSIYYGPTYAGELYTAENFYAHVLADAVAGALAAVTGTTLSASVEVENMAALKAVSTASSPVFMRGFETDGDVGNGHFVWKGAMTDDEVTGIIVKKTGVETGRWVRLTNGSEILTSYLGDVEDTGVDSSGLIQEALDYAATLRGVTVRNPTVKMRHGGAYVINSGIVIPYGITLDQNGATLEYMGSTIAVTAGDRLAPLNYFTNYINFFIKLYSHTATGLKTVAVSKSYFKGSIEGYTVGITNARTCVGVEINGGEASSYENVFDVFCNHLHINFKMTSDGVGGHQPTAQIFENCSGLGDYNQSLPSDSNSYGFYFADHAPGGMGDGTIIKGCNVEACGTGMYFGDGVRNIMVDARFEISSWGASDTRVIKFHAGSDNIHVRGSGLQIATMGAVNGGIEGFAAGRHFIYSDNNGHSRECGNDTNITSGNPTKAWGYKDFFFKKDQLTRLLTMEAAGNSGGILLQAGAGSSYGGFIGLYADANTDSGKNVDIGPSIGGAVNFLRYYGSIQKLASLDYQLAADETAFSVLEGTGLTLKRVKLAAADGSGHRALYIEA